MTLMTNTAPTIQSFIQIGFPFREVEGKEKGNKEKFPKSGQYSS